MERKKKESSVREEAKTRKRGIPPPNFLPLLLLPLLCSTAKPDRRFFLPPFFPFSFFLSHSLSHTLAYFFFEGVGLLIVVEDE